MSVRKRWYGAMTMLSLAAAAIPVGACRDHDGSASGGRKGLAAGVSGVIEACADYCDRCDGPAWCEADCRESIDPSVMRGSYLAALVECNGCSEGTDDRQCHHDARAATGPATEAGKAYCVEHESLLESCLVRVEGTDIEDCEDWTRQIADAGLPRFDPCFTYPDCSDLFECIQQVFQGEKPEEYVPECSWDDDSCTDPDDLDPRNSCATARDYRCDGPNVCPVGTDTEDCEYNDTENRCDKAYNGKCDEPGTCKPGTDTHDCELAEWGNRCEHAYDGVCDEPRRCLLGTDTYDCALPEPMPDAGTDAGTSDGGVDDSAESDASAS